jgi:hypothetical protein
MTPEQLQEALANEKKRGDAAEERVTELELQGAVEEAAEKAGLAPSLTYAFLKVHNRLANIDMSSDTSVIEKEVAKLVQEAGEAEGNLKARQVPPRSGTDLGGGGSPDGEVKTLEGAIAKRMGAGTGS